MTYTPRDALEFSGFAVLGDWLMFNDGRGHLQILRTAADIAAVWVTDDDLRRTIVAVVEPIFAPWLRGHPECRLDGHHDIKPRLYDPGRTQDDIDAMWTVIHAAVAEQRRRQAAATPA